MIIASKRDIASGVYTSESVQALKGVINEVNALFDDDSTTAEDVRAAEAKLLEAWRCLEFDDSPADEDKQKWRDAVSELAKALIEIYSKIDPEEYKPSPYAEFTQKTDEAYELLGKDDSAANDLLDMKTKLMQAWAKLEKNGRRCSVAKVLVKGISPATYNGKPHKPSPEVTFEGKTLSEGTDYTVAYKNNTNAGTASIVISGIGDYNGETVKAFTIVKAANPLTVKAKTASVKYSKLKKKKQTLDITKLITFTKDGQGAMEYSLSSAKKGTKSFRKYFIVNATTGKVTIRKGLKRGTYKVMIKARAAGNNNYKASKENKLRITIKVK